MSDKLFEINEFQTMNDKVAANLLPPSHLQNVRNFTYTQRGALESISGNQLLELSTTTDIYSPEETTAIDACWKSDGAGGYTVDNGNFLKDDIFAIRMTITSRTILTNFVQLVLAEGSSTFSGTLYKGTSTSWVETDTTPPAYDNTTGIPITATVPGAVYTYSIPTSWFTGTTSMSIVVVPDVGNTGYFYSAAFTGIFTLYSDTVTRVNENPISGNSWTAIGQNDFHLPLPTLTDNAFKFSSGGTNTNQGLYGGCYTTAKTFSLPSTYAKDVLTFEFRVSSCQQNLQHVFVYGASDVIQYSPDGVYLTLYGFLNATQTLNIGDKTGQLATAQKAIGGGWNTAKIEMNNDGTLNVRIWPTDTTEPTTWDVTGTRSGGLGTTSNKLQFGIITGSTAYCSGILEIKNILVQQS